MPTIATGNKILVSGANGYLAMWVTRLFLERGYEVRGTVRTEAKVKFMKDYFTSLGYGDKLELVIVDDIVKEGAFDEAVRGVDGIAHTASPFQTDAKDPQELIRPAVQGTVGMLKSALKYGNQVKRVVITSSCAAIVIPPSQPTLFSERDWDNQSPKDIEEQGANVAGMTIYRASKALAEKEAWDFYNKIKTEVSWDLSVINPPYVYGPPIHDIASFASLNTSLQSWYDIVVAGTAKTREALSVDNSWVDVRDAALAHVLALEKGEAGDERIIMTEGGYIWQEWLDAANSITPSPFPSRKLPRGFPEIIKDENANVRLVTYDKSKEERILGIKFHTKLETTRDTLEDFANRGW